MWPASQNRSWNWNVRFFCFCSHSIFSWRWPLIGFHVHSWSLRSVQWWIHTMLPPSVLEQLASIDPADGIQKNWTNPWVKHIPTIQNIQNIQNPELLYWFISGNKWGRLRPGALIAKCSILVFLFFPISFPLLQHFTGSRLKHVEAFNINH